MKINEYGVNALKDAVNRAVMQFMVSIDVHDVKIWRPSYDSNPCLRQRMICVKPIGAAYQAEGQNANNHNQT